MQGIASLGMIFLAYASITMKHQSIFFIARQDSEGTAVMLFRNAKADMLPL